MNPTPSTPSNRRGTLLRLAVIAGIVSAIALTYLALNRGPRRLVVYCAHDAVYSEPVLRQFEKDTGIPVDIRFDTEATKSLGLIELILRERDNPRCDVFWNNEVLGAMRLHREGVLQPWRGLGYERIPAAFREPGGHWTGFAARMRVVIFNTGKTPAPTEDAVTFEGDLSRVALAKPLYGTTFTHYCILWNLWGPEKLKQWHRDCRKAGLIEAKGNAHVKNLTAEGQCDWGWTDTDDYFVAKDQGKPVTMLPATVGDGRTVVIPNTVMIIKGTRRPAEAQKLVDYLLSAKTEILLANSTARQVPLGPVDAGKLNRDVVDLMAHAARGYPLSDLGRAPEECLAWLKSEYLK